MRTLKYKATTRSARYEFSSKQVRASCSKSAQNSTSSEVRRCAEGTQEEAKAKEEEKRWRDATKPNGEAVVKWAVLSLFHV